MDFAELTRLMSYIFTAILAFAAALGKAEHCYQCTHPITFEVMTGLNEACSDRYDSAGYNTNQVHCPYGCIVTRTFDAGQMKATIRRGCAKASPSECPQYFTIEEKSLNINICCAGDFCNRQKYELGLLVSLVVVCLTVIFQILYKIFLTFVKLVLFLLVSLIVIFIFFYTFL